MVDTLWAGTEKSLSDHIIIEARLAEKMASWNPNDGEPEEPDVPYLFSLSGNIGVIRIVGPLSNKEPTFFDRMFGGGATSYGAIREAMIYAAGNAEVQHILMVISSGGGSATGVSDAADLIRTINDKVKPVTAFAEGDMASAAYWLGAAAGETYATNMSSVGSIGILATHMERSKQLAEDGIGVTVFRGGKYKALVNGVERLTAEAKTLFQAQIDEAEKVFVQAIANLINQPYDYVYENLAQGREFFGEHAFRAGLVDGITTFDKIMTKIQNNLDNSHSFSDTSRNLQGGSTMVKKALTEKEIAAIAEGSSSITAGAEVSETPEQIAEKANAAAAVLAAAEKTKLEASTEKPSDVVAYMQSQIKDRDATILANGIELSMLRAKSVDADAAVSGLLAIAGNSIKNMQVAMGASGSTLAGLSATEVLAIHKSVTSDFQTKFKAGGVAAVDAAEASKSEGDVIDHLYHARIRAVSSTARAN